MSTLTQPGFQQADFDAFLAARREPDWLRSERRQAWETFQQLDWPARNSEEWMRTDVRLFKLDRFPLVQEPPSVPTGQPHGLLDEGVELAGQACSVNSQSASVRLDSHWRDKGVLFGSLEQLLREHGETLRAHLWQAVSRDRDKFAALHAACWCGGTLLYVPRGVVIDQPLHALSLLEDGATDLDHTLVVLEEGAEATLLRESLSTSEQAGGLHCGAVELLLAPRAQLRFVNLQNWGYGVWHFAQQKAVLQQDASLQWTVGALGGRLAKVNQQVALAGPGASTQVNGVLFTQGKQHMSYHTVQHHEAPQSRSDFLYKAALQDQSRTVWRGMIKVDPGAQRTDGYQRNDNLLLSENARADSIPGLEIEADDVRCTHGSTSGRVDDEQVFYTRTRGFTRKEAVRMIVSGFFQQIFDRITIPSVREALGHAVARRVRQYD